MNRNALHCIEWCTRVIRWVSLMIGWGKRGRLKTTAKPTRRVNLFAVHQFPADASCTQKRCPLTSLSLGTQAHPTNAAGAQQQHCNHQRCRTWWPRMAKKSTATGAVRMTRLPPRLDSTPSDGQAVRVNFLIIALS